MGEKAAESRSELFFSDDITDDLPPIARRHLHGELCDRLRDAIITGELAPDAKVPEKELCERFGVSRTPLREALKVLAHEGLVVLNHNRGASVRPLTVQDLDEAFPVYAQLEALAGELACKHATTDEIRDVRRLSNELTASTRSRDLKRYFEIDVLIHERIQLAAHNSTLAQLLRFLSGRIRRARNYASAMDLRSREAVRDHEGIVSALEARDAEKLPLLLRKHTEHALTGVKAALIRESETAELREGLHSLSGAA